MSSGRKYSFPRNLSRSKRVVRCWKIRVIIIHKTEGPGGYRGLHVSGCAASSSVSAVAATFAPAEPTEWPATRHRDRAFSGFPKNAVDPHLASARRVDLHPFAAPDKRNHS